MQGGRCSIPLFLEEKVADGKGNESSADHGKEPAQLQEHEECKQRHKEGETDQGVFHKSHDPSLAANPGRSLRPGVSCLKTASSEGRKSLALAVHIL